MTNYPLTMAAAKRAAKSQWAIGDALLAEIPMRTARSEIRFRDCARELAAAGMPYSPDYLKQLRDMAAAFKGEDRADVTPRNAKAAQTPDLLRKAREIAREDARPLTQRFIQKVARGARREAGRPVAPEAKPRKPHDVPVSAIRRQANVMELSKLAIDAAGFGRKLSALLADVVLERDEKDALLEEIARVRDTWKAVEQQVKHPVAEEAARLLRGH